MLRFIMPSDAPDVAPISRAARFEAIPNYPDLHTTEEDLAFYTNEIATSQGFVAENENGEVVGFILWRDDFINHLYLKIDWQGQGIGSALLMGALQNMDSETVNLWTFQSNVKAVAFYKKHGFSVIKESAGQNEEGLPDFLFSRKRQV
jgi:putative acetyltransferase